MSSVVRDDRVEVHGEKVIRNEYQKEFEKRLRNRTPDDDWAKYTKNVNKLLEILLSKVERGEDFTIEELKTAISKLKTGKAPGEDSLPAELFINAGDGLLRSLLIVLNEVKRTYDIPEQWDWVIITTIYKMKGSKKQLVNYRGIFLTTIVSKIFENLLKDRMKVELKLVNLHQAGSRPNRSAADNLFLLRECISHQKYKGKALFVTAYDFEQAFDSLWLQDCIMAMMRLGVRKDILKLVYHLNKVAKFRVRTPYGLTDVSAVKDIVEQGTVLGPVLCSTSTAEYCEINKGVAVGTTQVRSLLFVDDIVDVSICEQDAVENHDNAIIFSKKKKLSYSKTKCKTLVINPKKGDKCPSLYIEGSSVEGVDKITYLGDVVNSRGNNSDLVQDRVKRGTSAMVRMEALIKDIPLGIHTVKVHLLLYRSLFLSCVLFNSQAWSNILESDLKPLQTLQMKVLKKVLTVPQSTANSFVCLEFGVLPIKYVMHRNQLMFLQHIFSLQEEDPVRMMLDNMKKLSGEKNWWSDVKALLQMYKLSEVDAKKSRGAFKKMVDDAVGKVAFEDLTRDCGEKSKTRNLHYNELKMQEYLTYLYPKQSQIIFQCRSKTLDIKQHRPYKFSDKVCRGCNEGVEELEHIVNCGYTHQVDIAVVDHEPTHHQLIMIANRIESFLDKFTE